MTQSAMQHQRSTRHLPALRRLCLGLLAACCSVGPAVAAGAAAPEGESRSSLPYVAKFANFAQAKASPEARDIADWVVDSGDNNLLPFAIVDKKQARVFVFDARGNLTGAAAALLGLAIGDDSVAGIGDRPMASIRPEERTTPAGRFVVSMDHNAAGKNILWIDYDAAISLHAVVAGTVTDRRTQRLSSPSALDKRISFGCINVPAMFFEQVVQPAFSRSNGIVYVLPETRSASKMFAAYKVNEYALAQNAGQPPPATINALALGSPLSAR